MERCYHCGGVIAYTGRGCPDQPGLPCVTATELAVNALRKSHPPAVRSPNTTTIDVSARVALIAGHVAAGRFDRAEALMLQTVNQAHDNALAGATPTGV